MSGLQINAMKSNMYFGQVSNELKKFLLSTLGFQEGQLPARYLGLPLISRKLYVNDYKIVLVAAKNLFLDYSVLIICRESSTS